MNSARPDPDTPLLPPAREPQSQRYFRNTACAYFPCHAGVDPAEFNCLFCYCPLYFLADCGGTPDLSRGIKDCTPCVNPHAAGGYDRVLTRLKREFARLREEAGKRDPGPEAPAGEQP
jgi:Zn-finger protein